MQAQIENTFWLEDEPVLSEEAQRGLRSMVQRTAPRQAELEERHENQRKVQERTNLVSEHPPRTLGQQILRWYCV